MHQCNANLPSSDTCFLSPEQMPITPPTDFLKFARVVNGIFYIDDKHADKIKPFADNKAVVDYVCDMIDSFEVPASEVTQSMAYSMLLLAYSETDRAVGILKKLCRQAIDEDYFGMCLNLSFALNAAKTERTEPLRKEMRQYLTDDFQKAFEKSQYFRLADEIGLDVSSIAERTRNADHDISSSYSFDLSTVEGVRFEIHADAEDKKRWYVLCVRINGPGAYHDLDIEILSNHQDPRSYSILWNSPYEPYSYSKFEYMELNLDGRLIEIPNGCDLLHLKETVAQIERLMGVKFIRKPVCTRFSQSIKNRKKLTEWLMKE
ncbi:MAG: hypothetical protein VB092_06255 [Oscillospiraceae bacterium]|nr:hypothetical protein [Oscillospiraceae bacterium]